MTCLPRSENFSRERVDSLPRKSAESLADQRNDIKKRYKGGKHTRRELVSFDSLSEVEQAVKKEAACFLKAADYSHTYIAEALGTTRGVVKEWFAGESGEVMRARVQEIQQDYIDGAVKLLKTYAIELIEMLVEIARDERVDAKTRIQAITEALDRAGMSKVNKSQSAATITEKHVVDITDKTGLVEALRDAPPEVQQEVARRMEETMALVSEHTAKDVTHA